MKDFFSLKPYDDIGMSSFSAKLDHSSSICTLQGLSAIKYTKMSADLIAVGIFMHLVILAAQRSQHNPQIPVKIPNTQ